MTGEHLLRLVELLAALGLGGLVVRICRWVRVRHRREEARDALLVAIGSAVLLPLTSLASSESGEIPDAQETAERRAVVMKALESAKEGLCRIERSTP